MERRERWREYVEEAIRTNATELNLSMNTIGAEGAKSLIHMLEQNSTLATLDLWGNNIGDEGAKLLSQMLEKNSTLTELNLRGNKIGYEGAKLLSVALEKNSTLTELDLSRNGIGTEGVKSLRFAMEKNSTLKELNLEDQSTEPEGAKWLSVTLEKNSTLTDLDLEETVPVQVIPAQALALRYQTCDQIPPSDQLRLAEISVEHWEAIAALMSTPQFPNIKRQVRGERPEGAKLLTYSQTLFETLAKAQLRVDNLVSAFEKLRLVEAVQLLQQ